MSDVLKFLNMDNNFNANVLNYRNLSIKTSRLL